MTMSDWPRRFFSDLYGRVLAAQFTREQSEKQARVVARALQLRKGMRVLDIPCGLGRLTLPLARRGLEMTGVDLTESYIRKARRLSQSEGLDVRFLAQDMRRIEFREEFDAAFNWFTSFGYYSEKENLLCLRRLRDALKPGGQVLIETLNPSWIKSHFRPSGEQTIGRVRVEQTRHRTGPSDPYSRTTWALTYRGRTVRNTIAIRLYNGAEMRQLLQKAGFGEIRLYGHNRLDDPPGQRFTRHSRRLIAVARRP
jgi:2-polyprenyl-3-methyl-5-hydroxy-6-metoxy-1,4-benzoquinol methylase